MVLDELRKIMLDQEVLSAKGGPASGGDENNLEDQQEGPAFNNEFKNKGKKEINPRFLFGFIMIVAVVGLVFAGFGWFNSLKTPFLVRSNVNASDLNLSLTNSDVANLLALQGKDTDLDGLSDYDELYVHRTSPYLPDTDSDGYPDGEEIQNAQDPNCPAGTDCGQSLTTPAVTPELPASMDNLTAEQIKSLLLQAGVTEEQISALSETELRQLYQEALQETQTADESQTLQELAPENANLVTPDQLRAILRDEGLNEEELNNLTDEDLNTLWQEILKDEEFKIQP